MATAVDVMRAAADLHAKIAKDLDDAPTGVEPGYHAALGGTVMPNGKIRYVASGSQLGGAHVYNSATHTLTNNTTTTATYDTEMYDASGYWTISAPTIITIPADGRYQVVVHNAFASNATGRRSVQVRARYPDVGGATFDWPIITAGANAVNGAAHYFPPLVTIRDFVAGTVLLVRLFQNSGGNLDMVSAGDSASSPLISGGDYDFIIERIS